MQAIVGSCPDCGCPTYAPPMRLGGVPPPSTPTCRCAVHATRGELLRPEDMDTTGRPREGLVVTRGGITITYP